MYHAFGMVVLVVAVAAGALWYARSPIVSIPEIDPTEEVVCTADVQLCEDGSYVSRVAPGCTCASCPGIKAESTTGVGMQSVWQDSGIAVTPLEILEDSRCPEDVMCVQAGTLRLKVAVQLNGGAVQEMEVSLGMPSTLADGRALVLQKVLPQSFSTVFIQAEEYRFEFAVISAVVE